MLFLSPADWATWFQVGINTLLLAAQGVQMGFQIHLMNNISKGAWLFKQARKFCIEFDQIIIQYSDKVYGYFIEVINGTLITPELIDGLMSKIYIIVGIFIFFKIMMVAIRYMVNPEQFLDDKAGAQTIVKRVIFGTLIIACIPLIFDTASKLQSAIIKDRVIEKIILPDDVYKTVIKSQHPGRDLSMMVHSGFFSWNDAFKPSVNQKLYNSVEKVKTYNDLGLFDKDLINEVSGNDKYYINYIPIISTLATGYLLFMLIKYTIEVAFRSFKMMFLQILAPFVIVNYMLDASKEETMKKWINATVSTYIMIFIRVLTLWLAVLIAYYLKNGINGESLLNSSDPLLKSLLIIAVFALLKDLPKLISEIFGYNLQENETISGVMNQGVNVLKGFAMGKVAMGITKPMRTAGYVASGLGAAGNALGGFTKTNLDAKASGANKSTALGMGLGSGLAGLSGGANAVNSTLGSVTSSFMGQTFMAPVAQTASASLHTASVDQRLLMDGRDVKNEKDIEKANNNNASINNEAKIENTINETKEIAHQAENSFIQQLQNDATFSNYVSGSSFNLSSSVDNRTFSNDNPIVNAMAERVYEDVGRPSEISTQDIASQMVNYIYADDSKINNPTQVSSSDISTMMSDIKKEITSKIDVTEVLDVSKFVSNSATKDANQDIGHREN